MKQIEGVNLVDLVQNSAEQVLQERIKGAKGQIKALFYHMERLLKEKASKTKELKRLDEKINSLQTKIDKLRSGDWSQLAEEVKKEEKQN